MYELLRDLREVVPGVLELEIEELLAGLRPATPDNLPAIGRGALDGLVWATGHYRNGILLAAGHRPSSSPPRCAASRCRTGPRAADPRALRAGAGMKVVLNGEAPSSRRRRDGAGAARRRSTCPAAARGVAVAVDAEVVPRGEWDDDDARRGRAGRGPARDPGRLSMAVTDTTTADPLTIAGRELRSRLLLGTGGFRSLEALAAAIEASGTELVTVALRRIDPAARGSIVDVLDARGRAAAARTPPAASRRATRC